jgi:hypothetical protein
MGDGDGALRARIVLACAQGGSNLAVAARLGVNRTATSRHKLAVRMMARPGRPPKAHCHLGL